VSRGDTSPLKSVTLAVALSHEWTVWPPLLLPEKRVKSVVPTLTCGRLSFTTPNGLMEAPRGNGSSNAPIQTIISYLANVAFEEVSASESMNISQTTFARVLPSIGDMLQVIASSRVDTFFRGIGRSWALFN